FCPPSRGGLGAHPSQRSTSGLPRTTRHAGCLPCLILLRVGFTEPPWLPKVLVRSYRTVSPLPVLGCPSHRRSFLCGTFLHVTATHVSRAPCPMEPRLSSSPVAKRRGHPVDSPSVSSLTQLFKYIKPRGRGRERAVASPRGQ